MKQTLSFYPTAAIENSARDDIMWLPQMQEQLRRLDEQRRREKNPSKIIELDQQIRDVREEFNYLTKKLKTNKANDNLADEFENASDLKIGDQVRYEYHESGKTLRGKGIIVRFIGNAPIVIDNATSIEYACSPQNVQKI